jgi:hypothetical protein
MSIKDANIWKSSELKSLKTLFSSPQRVQASLFISDTGIISLQNIPMATGWVYLAEEKLSWMVDQRCIQPMQDCDVLVMPISERSFRPLDPLGNVPEDRQVSLNEIAWSKRREAFSRVLDENKQNAGQKLMQTTLYGFLLITAIVVLFFLMRHK